MFNEAGIVHYFAAALPAYARVYTKVGLAPIDEPYRVPLVVDLMVNNGGGMESGPLVERAFLPLYMNASIVERQLVRARKSGSPLPDGISSKATAYIAPHLLAEAESN